MSDRLSARFERLRGRAGLVAFVCAGDPSPELTPAILDALVYTKGDRMMAATAAAMGFSPLGVGMLGGSLLVRWLVAWHMARHTHDRVFRDSWFWLPVRDMLSAAVWCAAGLGGEVSWRGRRYALRQGGRLQRLT